MKHFQRILILVFAGLSILMSSMGCRNVSSEAKSISVFAGSAIQPALEEAARAFQQKTNITVNLNFGGSGTVLSQMILSRTGDLYIPASPDYLAKAQAQGVVAAGDNGKILVYLVPAILIQKGNPKNIKSLSDLLRPDVSVGIANPSSVVVGLFAVEILDKNDLLDGIKQVGTVKTYPDSAEKTATLVALKALDAAIDWSVFASWNPDSIEVVYLDANQLPRLTYMPGAVSTFTRDKDSAQKFLDFLTSKDGQAIFAGYGYQTTEDEARKFAPDANIGGEYNLPAGFTTLVK